MTSFKLKLKIKKYFPVGLFIMLYKVVRTLNLWMKSYGVTRHSNESFYKQYFPVVLFIMLYSVVLIFKSVECDHSNERYTSSTVNNAVQSGSTLECVGDILQCGPTEMKAWSSLSLFKNIFFFIFLC